MPSLLTDPWPWYVAGPLIGLVVPLLLLFGGRVFGVSSCLRHLCAAAWCGKRPAFLDYPWRKSGGWNLVFVAGALLGGFVAGQWLVEDAVVVEVSPETRADAAAMGITSEEGYAPPEIFSLEALSDPVALLILIVGGILLGFGARWAGGCTSGHAISGLANLQLPSLVAVCGFFAGGLLATHLLLPWVLS